MEESSLRFSEKRDQLFKALLKAKLDFPAVERDTLNPFARKKYATLDGIQENVDPVLAVHGLVYSQHPLQGNRLVTIVYHIDSDQWMESEYGMKPVKEGPQEIGALITYMKRYALVAILGIRVLDEDDDGNSAQGRKEEGVAKKQKDEAIKQLNSCKSAAEVKKVFSEFSEDYRKDPDIFETATKLGKELKKKEEDNGAK